MSSSVKFYLSNVLEQYVLEQRAWASFTWATPLGKFGYKPSLKRAYPCSPHLGSRKLLWSEHSPFVFLVSFVKSFLSPLSVPEIFASSVVSTNYHQRHLQRLHQIRKIEAEVSAFLLQPKYYDFSGRRSKRVSFLDFISIQRFSSLVEAVTNSIKITKSQPLQQLPKSKSRSILFSTLQCFDIPICFVKVVKIKPSKNNKKQTIFGGTHLGALTIQPAVHR